MFSLHIDTARTWRGGQNQVLLTVQGLGEIGQRTALVAHADGELRRRAAEGLELIPVTPRTEVDFSAAWRLSRVIRQLAPDIVHAHDPHAVAMAALARSMAQSPAGRGPVLVAARRVDFPLKRNSFSRWKYRQVDCFIASSEAIRRILLRDGVEPARVITVHEGVDVAKIRATPVVNLHEDLWLPHDAPLAGNVAALAEHKGQRYLIDAARQVVQELPDARLVILGEGDLREPLERQVRDARLEKHVLMPGFRRDVIGCIKHFDLFAMSSITEGLGTSLLDAMACGRAIVATDVGGIPEVVADGVNGVLVPARDAQRMGRAIADLLAEDRRRTEMGDAGAARVAERFTVERMVARTAGVYEQLAGRRRAAGTGRLSARD
jgi:glycosyltransferase involved in cell wall biosynthesis